MAIDLSNGPKKFQNITSERAFALSPVSQSTGKVHSARFDPWYDAGIRNADDAPLFEELVARIPAGWSEDDFVICGSAALAVRGVRDVHDLDILVRTEEMVEDVDDLLRKGELTPFVVDNDADLSMYAESSIERRKLVLTQEMDVFDSMPRVTGLTFEHVHTQSDKFRMKDGRVFRIVSPRHCLAVKTLIPILRPKDLVDMERLARIIAAEDRLYSGRVETNEQQTYSNLDW
tara:strand:- start:39910 stop:40605 length:696 start_codon:yes stop_codon:yes gene_type:complete